MKKWTRDKVINTLQDCDGYEKFLNESGILSICVDNVDLLFFYAYDRVEIYYKNILTKLSICLQYGNSAIMRNHT